MSTTATTLAPAPPARRGRKPNYGRYGLELVMIAAAVVFLFPVYALITLAMKDPRQISESPLSPPAPPTLANFGDAWTSASLGPALLNSTIITVTSLLTLIVLGSTGAYYLARRARGLGYGLYVLFLLGIVLPFQLGMIPLYKLVDDLGWLGTYQGMVFFYTGIQLPFTVFLYTGFIRALPQDYASAALIDGCNHRQAFTRIVFPLLRPITGTVIILNAVLIWNDFFTPLLYLGGSGKETVPVRVFRSSASTSPTTVSSSRAWSSRRCRSWWCSWSCSVTSSRVSGGLKG